MSEREAFEKWISKYSTYYRDLRLWSSSFTWPGYYRDLIVQIAWEAWQESARNRKI